MSWLKFTTTIVVLGILLVPDPAYPQGATGAGHLLINEIGLSENSVEYVELYNPTPHPISLVDCALVFANPSFTIDFDSDLPDCPAGGLVLIASDAEFTNLDPGTIFLRVPGLDTVRSSWNYLAGIAFGSDAVYWGIQPDAPNPSIYASPPILPPYEVLDDENSVAHDGDVIFRVPGNIDSGTSDKIWVWRGADHASPGKHNPMPGPWLMLPPDGSKIASDFALGVSGLDWAADFQFQLARDSTFSDILIDETVEVPSLFIDTLTGGDYVWRCRGLKEKATGPWSP